MKKILVSIMVCVMALTTFGCGGKKGTTDDPNASQTQSGPESRRGHRDRRQQQTQPAGQAQPKSDAQK